MQAQHHQAMFVQRLASTSQTSRRMCDNEHGPRRVKNGTTSKVKSQKIHVYATRSLAMKQRCPRHEYAMWPCQSKFKFIAVDVKIASSIALTEPSDAARIINMHKCDNVSRKFQSLPANRCSPRETMILKIVINRPRRSAARRQTSSVTS